ncbi:MAG: LytR family transcriptional regulator [Clostridia bacterium]|nr:LytR family transcriptional regulator [Clostridia bacterium]
MSAEEISAANDCIAGLNKQRGIADLWDGFIFAEAGNVKLTGKQALGYSRIRKIDSDFSRGKRQFKVLNAVFAQFKAAGLSKQYKLLDKILPLVETDITNARILECATNALSLNTKGLLYYRVPVEGLYKSGKWERSFVFLMDMPANALALHQFLFDSQEEADEAKVLSPGASLPPRTPSIYLGEDGNYYSYATGQIVPGQTPDPAQADAYVGQTYTVNGVTVTVDAAGNLVDQSGNIVAAAGTWQFQQ